MFAPKSLKKKSAKAFEMVELHLPLPTLLPNVAEISDLVILAIEILLKVLKYVRVTELNLNVGLALLVVIQDTLNARTVVYVIDSGCTQSILANKSRIENYSSCDIKMITADDGILQCVGQGDLIINSELTIRNVLHCPDASANLMPTYLITRAGATILFGSEGPNCDQDYCDIRCVRPAVRGGGKRPFLVD